MLDIVIDSRKAFIGPGLGVNRILPFRQRRMVGPFIFMDHAGPVELKGPISSTFDVLPHPHIGLSTVSYLFGGSVTHRDSLGVEQVIKPGEVNWMTAGKGISHSERFEDPEMLAGGELEMIQTWVALPEKDEDADPSFNNYTVDELPVFTDKGIWMRLIAGDAYGLKSSVKTSSPMFYLHVVLDQGTRFSLPKEHAERGLCCKGQHRSEWPHLSKRPAARIYSRRRPLDSCHGRSHTYVARRGTFRPSIHLVEFCIK